MATLAKKRAVYVRGPDSVYRRKSGPASLIYLADSADIKRKEEVDHMLNELMECGFQVDGQKLPDPAGHQHSSSYETSSPRAVSPRDRFPASIATASSESAEAAFLMPKLNTKLWVSREKALAQLAPFLLGMATTYVLQASLPTLTHYAIIAAGFVKLGLIWAIFTSVVCWYAGLLKVSSLTDARALATRTWLTMNGAELPGYPKRRAHVPQSPVTEHTLEEIVEPELPDPSEHVPVTNVRPFVAPLRTTPEARLDSKLDSKQDKRLFRPPRLVRQSTDLERKRGIRVASPPRRHSSASLDIPDLKDTYDKYKPLPPVTHPHYTPGGELPLVYEVKLMGDDLYEDRLGRLPTTMSKKSVLGTRANYNRFLANVDSP